MGATASALFPSPDEAEMDARLARARELHREAMQHEENAAQARGQRDDIIMQLVRDHTSYAQIARTIGCSPELVAKIVRLRKSAS